MIPPSAISYPLSCYRIEAQHGRSEAQLVVFCNAFIVVAGEGTGVWADPKSKVMAVQPQACAAVTPSLAEAVVHNSPLSRPQGNMPLQELAEPSTNEAARDYVLEVVALATRPKSRSVSAGL